MLAKFVFAAVVVLLAVNGAYSNKYTCSKAENGLIKALRVAFDRYYEFFPGVVDDDLKKGALSFIKAVCDAIPVDALEALDSCKNGKDVQPWRHCKTGDYAAIYDEVSRWIEQFRSAQLIDELDPYLDHVPSAAEYVITKPADVAKILKESDTVHDDAKISKESGSVHNDDAKVSKDSGSVHNDDAKVSKDSGFVHNDDAKVSKDSGSVHEAAVTGAVTSFEHTDEAPHVAGVKADNHAADSLSPASVPKDTAASPQLPTGSRSGADDVLHLTGTNHESSTTIVVPTFTAIAVAFVGAVLLF